MTAVIQVEALSKQYEMGHETVHALRQVSFSVENGAFLAIMGPSGSGKSTLMHLLGCLDTPSNGRYWLDGQDVSNFSRRARAQIRNQYIGFVFQSFNLLPRLSTHHNVKLPLMYRSIKNGLSDDQLVEQALAQVGLSDRADHKPTELSGGQRQRVAIARALVADPTIILADEPTGNLDSRTGGDILSLLKTLNENGRTIILVTHDAQVAQHAQRTLTMQDGEIVRDGSGVS